MSEVIVIRGTRHVVWECKTCGVISTCPETVMDQQRAEGGYHSCSNGHKWGWDGERCEREKLRRERDNLKQQVAQRDDEIRAKEQELVRVKKRASAGTCPCCNRTFSNMSRHMKTKHPTYNVVPLKTGTKG